MDPFLIIHAKIAKFITQDTLKMYFYFKIILHKSVWLIIVFPQHVWRTVYLFLCVRDTWHDWLSCSKSCWICHFLPLRVTMADGGCMNFNTDNNTLNTHVMLTVLSLCDLWLVWHQPIWHLLGWGIHSLAFTSMHPSVH